MARKFEFDIRQFILAVVLMVAGLCLDLCPQNYRAYYFGERFHINRLVNYVA